jgi:hypothetical protein
MVIAASPPANLTLQLRAKFPPSPRSCEKILLVSNCRAWSNIPWPSPVREPDGDSLGIMRQFSFHGSDGKKHPVSLCGDKVESSLGVFFPPMLPALIVTWLPNHD